jgi:hypothetical protein
VKKYNHFISAENNWNLTTEKKSIQGFECYRNTISRTVRMNKNKDKTCIWE